MRGALLVFAATAFATPLRAAEPPAVSPAAQLDRQKRATAAVEQTARHVTTSLRVLAYQKLDPTAEQRVLDDVAGSLKRLSKDDMAAILTHLETAVAAPNESAASAEQREAFQKHREVVSTLRGLLFQLDVLNSLDEAATRYSNAAKAEFALHQRALRADAMIDAPRVRNPNRQLSEEREQQGDAQTDIKSEMASLIKQLAVLKSKLSPEQRTRLDKSDAVGRTAQLVRQAETALQSLAGKNFRDAASVEAKVARELQSIAAALATPRDTLAVLKETRVKVEDARKAEEELKAATQATIALEKTTKQQFLEATQKIDAEKVADRQGMVEFETREARKALETVSPELAARLTPAESEMRRAQDELRETKLPDARTAESNAIGKLEDALRELDERIAQAEKAKTDPLTATQKAAQAIEKLIGDQKAAQKLTKANESKPEQLKPAADAQAEVAKDVKAAAETPLPENAAVQKLMAEAAKKAAEAAKELATNDAKDAQPKQAEALKALEAAKKGLEEQAKAIEERRDDIAKLEEAKKTLGEVAEQEAKLAQQAKAAAEQPKPDDGANAELAKAQEKLTPPTKDLAEALKATSPEAAAKVQEAAEKQQAAKEALAKNEPKPGAEQADAAAKKLNEAGDSLDKKLAELQAKEVADQTALQPNQLDPADAAQQIAKALEQSQAATAAAKKAAEALDAKPAAGEPKMTGQEMLAELQKALGEKADAAGQPEAAKSAAKAAEALKSGDVPAALAEQKQAGEALAKAEAARPAAEKAQPDESKPTPGELAKDQEKLRQATEALMKSAEATAQARSALAQAQANAPAAVKPQLDGANGDLAAASKQLGQGDPARAGESQAKASAQLTQALAALNAAAQAKGDPTAKPGESQQAQANDKPGDKPGEQGKPTPKPGDKPGDGDPKADALANGDGAKGERLKAVVAGGADAAKKAGKFIDLQKMERDRVQQNADAAFPAEFRELIKQYYMNLQKSVRPARPPGK